MSEFSTLLFVDMGTERDEVCWCLFFEVIDDLFSLSGDDTRKNKKLSGLLHSSNFIFTIFEVLDSLSPGIDVNYIQKCTDIFILMSDILEMLPMADLAMEPMVAGGILVPMSKSLLHCDPAVGLEFFLTPLSRAIMAGLG